MRFLKFILAFFWANVLLGQKFDENLKSTIRRLYNEHEIIGIGEASHGTKSIYKFREFFIKTCLEEGEPINVLVEMPQGVGDLIKGFYNNKIDSSTFLKGVELYGLRTNSFLDFVLAFKNNPQVSIVGVDMQNQSLSLNQIEKYLKTSLPSKEVEIDSLIHPLRSASFEEMNNSVNKDSLKTVYFTRYKALDQFIKKNYEPLNKLDNVFIQLNYPMKTLGQFLEFTYEFQKGWISNFYRDSCMASNVLTYRDNVKGKIIVIGANLHVSKKSKFAGGIINEQLGEKYFVIGEQFYSGGMLVANFKEGHYVYEPICPKKSFPVLLQNNYNDTLIVFSELKEKKMSKLIRRPILIQEYGAGNLKRNKNNGLEYAIPSNLYDALYFFTKVEPSKSLMP